jgi:hypothetical protein
MNDNRDVPGAVQRVAEIASLLGEDRPTAKQLVKELFVRFAEIQEHYRSVQPVGRAPTDAGEPLQLYCPQQGDGNTAPGAVSTQPGSPLSMARRCWIRPTGAWVSARWTERPRNPHLMIGTPASISSASAQTLAMYHVGEPMMIECRSVLFVSGNVTSRARDRRGRRIDQATSSSAVKCLAANPLAIL